MGQPEGKRRHQRGPQRLLLAISFAFVLLLAAWAGYVALRAPISGALAARRAEQEAADREALRRREEERAAVRASQAKLVAQRAADRDRREKERQAYKKWVEDELRRLTETAIEAEDDPAIGVRWYRLTDRAQRAIREPGGTLYFYPYIGVDRSGYAWLCLKASYHGDKWVFVEKLVLMIDGEKTSIPLSRYSDVDSDVESGGVRESTVLTGKEELIRRIADARKVYVSMVGQHRRRSWRLRWYNLEDFRNVVAYFDLLQEVRQQG